MQINRFWQKWLLTITVLVILFGILLMIPNESALFDWLFNDRIKTTWSDISITDGVIQFQRWLNGVLGATMVGWGITMAFIIVVPFRDGEKWAWTCILLSICSWFILDTTISIIYWAVFNAIFNAIVFLLFMIPLLATYKAFHSELKSAAM